MVAREVRPTTVNNLVQQLMDRNARRHCGSPTTKETRVLPHKLRRVTVVKVLGTIRRLFAAAVPLGMIDSNPAIGVKVPKRRGANREIVKPRATLDDDELLRLIACDEADYELRMLSVVARCEGGMRTGDLHAWDWTMLDRDGFAWCTIPRCKTAQPDTLDVPEPLRPFLRAWWERAGRPSAGPVFPVRIGERAGEFRKPRASHAERLRRALIKAAIFRLPPVEVPATRPGTRTDRGIRAKGTKLAPNRGDPLYYETATSKRVDFHSFRRNFNTALAEADVNVQRAMHLAGHSNAATHMRYVMRTKAMRAIPDAALPRLSAVTIGEVSPRVPRDPRQGGDTADDAKGVRSVGRVGERERP
jgi:site-specific recombinase XerC